MNLKLTTLIAGLATLTLSATMASAAPWEQIGYQQADMNRDRDRIVVRGNDRHRQIRLCVERQPLRMRDMNVDFANGGNQSVALRQRFQPGSCTRVVDLRGRARNVAAINLFYDKVVNGPPAIVRVYAR